MQLGAGSRLGRYEILALAGAGGMGEVYRARDTRLERDVAIKVLPAEVADDPAWIARFEREARAVSALNHPRICALFDVGCEAVATAATGEHPTEAHFLVMEYLDGETLADRLAAGPLPLAETLRLGTQVAEALAAAHRAGVVHRDLKPGNVMITSSGAKLLDFGVAKPLAAGDTHQLAAAPTVTSPLTAQGTVVGTYQYMAPEVLAGREADARSDIFGLGAVLYEMAAGRPAFGGGTQATLVASILKDEARPLSEVVPGMPPALSRLVERCLAKEPDRRWQSAADLAMELEWLASGGESRALPATSDVSMATAPPARGSSRLAWAVASLFAVVALLLGVGGLRSRDSDDAPPPLVRFELAAPEGTFLRTMYESAAPPAVSPDGRFIVFGVMSGDGENRLWLRPLDGPARPLVGTDGGMRPFWSPDSQSIGFFTTNEMRRVDLAGGPPFSLAPVSGPRGGSWNADGTIIYAPSSTGPLYRVSDSTGDAKPVTKLLEDPKEASHRYPHFLPDGRHFLFLALDDQGAMGTSEESQQRLMLGSLDEGSIRLLIRGAANGTYAAGHLIYRRGAALQARPFDLDRFDFTGDPVTLAESVHYDSGYERAIFTASEEILAYVAGEYTGRTRFQLLDRSGDVLQTLAEVGVNFESRFAPKGRKMAARTATDLGAEAISILDLEENTRTRLTFGEGVPRTPVWAPDGTRVAYGWTTAGGSSTLVQRIDGDSAPEVLVGDSWGATPTAWSPDGRYLLLDRPGDDGVSSIWIVDLDEGGDPRQLIESEGAATLPDISPDGRWLAYSSNESGRLEVYVTRFPSARGKWLVSEGGGLNPQWDPGGRSLLYRSLDHAVMEVAVSKTTQGIRVGSARKLFELFAPIDIGESVYDLSPDGRTFAASTFAEDQLAAPLTVVVGWSRLLEP